MGLKLVYIFRRRFILRLCSFRTVILGIGIRHYITNSISTLVHKYRILHSVDLFKSQWWDYSELLDFQYLRLKEIVNYAYSSIPGYRNKWDEYGVSPSSIKSLDDIRLLPIINRHELQHNHSWINKREIENTLYTGGSTGTSLEYYDSSLCAAVRWNSHLRGWSWNGYRPGKRIAIIASSQGSVSANNVLTLSGDLSVSRMRQHSNLLLAFKPEYIRGYVSSLYIFALYLINNHISLHGVKAIDPISENLYDYQRKVIESAFNSTIFEEYCCNDGGASAWECGSHSGLHYAMERAIIEQVDGEMIVTDLWNKAMPFIRYRNGDAVEFLEQSCSCGRQLPLIRVKGRDNDIIITREGPLSPTALMYHGIGYNLKADFRSGIQCVQYIQEPGYILVANIVINDWCSEKEISSFVKALNRLAIGMTVVVNTVQTIESTGKGKRAFIINNDSSLLCSWNKSHNLPIDQT